MCRLNKKEKPQVFVARNHCQKTLKQHVRKLSQTWSVWDLCTSRNGKGIKSTVRGPKSWEKIELSNLLCIIRGLLDIVTDSKSQTWKIDVLLNRCFNGIPEPYTTSFKQNTTIWFIFTSQNTLWANKKMNHHKSRPILH